MFVSIFSSSYSNRASGCIPPRMSKYSANFSLLPHQFPFSFPLEQPLDGGLRRARLTLQEGAAALHPKLHRFSQTLLYCTERDKRNGDSCKRKPIQFQGCKTQKSRLTFGVKASALPQRVTMFDILSSAPPEEKIRVKD